VFELKAGSMQGASASVGVRELGLGGCEVVGAGVCLVGLVALLKLSYVRSRARVKGLE